MVLSERYGHYEAYPEGVGGGLWPTPWRPTTEPVHLPTRSQIASEFAVWRLVSARAREHQRPSAPYPRDNSARWDSTIRNRASLR